MHNDSKRSKDKSTSIVHRDEYASLVKEVFEPATSIPYIFAGVKASLCEYLRMQLAEG